MSSIYGEKLKVSIFGQSHSQAIGCSIDGLPAGYMIDEDELTGFMKRRAPGWSSLSTKRSEHDRPEIISGLVNGVTCGAPLAIIIKNSDTRSHDYDDIQDIPRPSHADYTAHVRYGGYQDHRGGGHFSGRMTAPLCAAGGICIQLLKNAQNIRIGAHILSIGEIEDDAFDPVSVSFASCEINDAIPVLRSEAGFAMRDRIIAARDSGDSVGGVIECAADGVPAGLGDPMFGGLENRIAAIVFGIPAVKGIEFGNGFASTRLRGSENNDEFFLNETANVKTRTNNCGGILGGITNGMPVVFRTAFKPTPSILLEQDSISLSRQENVKLKVRGRHDPCIVPRAVPCVEAAAAIALMDVILGSPRVM